MSREANLTISLLVATTVLATFHAHLPSLYELRRERTAPLDLGLRGTELQVIGTALIGGGAVSILARSFWPFAAAVLASASMLAQYEWGIQTQD